MGRICTDEENRNVYSKWGKEQKPNSGEETKSVCYKDHE